MAAPSCHSALACQFWQSQVAPFEIVKFLSGADTDILTDFKVAKDFLVCARDQPAGWSLCLSADGVPAISRQSGGYGAQDDWARVQLERFSSRVGAHILDLPAAAFSATRCRPDELSVRWQRL